MKFATTLFATILLSASPAFSDWQYTRWGMSSQELEAIGKGNVTPIPAHERDGTDVMGLGKASLQSGYVAEGITFTANYYFADDKLVAVNLKTKKTEEGVKLRETLRAIYGSPDSHERIGGSCEKTRWRDQRQGNMITFFYCPYSNTEGGFTARYQPIPKGGGL